MIITLDDAKSYLKIDLDNTEEDIGIESLIMAAEEYLKNVGAVLVAGNELAKLAVKILVVHWYENREPVGKADKLAFSLETIIPQLKFCYDEVGS